MTKTTVPDAKEGAEPAGAWAQSAKLAFRFLFLVVCLAALGWSMSNFRQVPPESRAIIYRFGSIVRQQGAGLLMAWPRPIGVRAASMISEGCTHRRTGAMASSSIRVIFRMFSKSRARRSTPVSATSA